MWKQVLVVCVAWVSAAAAHADAGLSELEKRWLTLSWPAVTYARQQGLPLDIVVQPQPTPGYAPLAMAYVDKRCKLVLSMRGNAEAQTTLDAIPEDLIQPVVEAMAAHELGHCWRYVRGAWHTLPAGFTAGAAHDASLDESTADKLLHMQRTRREEGFADLVGLAWTQARHPHAYARVHAWLVKFRDEPALPGSHHDTLAWISLAAQPSAFSASAHTPFDAAWPLWQQGLPLSRR
jgi:hypothetical protein